jgi:geranylgeranyl pyrophosphate synthase
VVARLAVDRRRVETALDALLPAAEAPPPQIHEAMRHSVFGGGKRLRPILVLAAGDVVGAGSDVVLNAACAVELIHTYSLVHDDLPAMDDSPTRRGRPSCHALYGDAVAILAGDALHAYAFEVLAKSATSPGIAAACVVRATAELARAIGTDGMVGGQMLDLLAAGTHVAEADVRRIHRLKTGALIQACLRIGAILGGASDRALDALSRYGANVGLAFQIVDDILDVVQDEEKLGKPAGADAAHAKITFPVVFGLAASRRLAQEATARAIDALEPLADRGDWLRDLSLFLLARDR